MVTAHDVSIIIPAFNEEMAIAAIIQDIKMMIPDAELIVVDDGSTDRTSQRAQEAGAAVIRHRNCRGYGAALRTGILAVARRYVLFCDGDGQHTAEDVKRLIEGCDEEDMIIGQRDSASHAPLLRAPGKFIVRHFANYLAGQRIPDVNSGLRMAKKEVLIKYLHLMPTGFSFSTTSTFAMLKGQYSVKWQPITVRKRIGKSTVRQWKHGPQTLLLMIRLTVLFEPLKVFLTVAGGLSILSIISLLIDVIAGEGFGIGDVTVMLSLSTVLVFMFGLVCEQVAALRRELHE